MKPSVGDTLESACKHARGFCRNAQEPKYDERNQVMRPAATGGEFYISLRSCGLASCSPAISGGRVATISALAVWYARTIPASLPGTEWINGNHIFCRSFIGEAPELTVQYVKAFQKIWAHRSEWARPDFPPTRGCGKQWGHFEDSGG